MASAYSVRPLPDARVSTPLTWDEVPTVEAEAFTLATVPGAVRGDRRPGRRDRRGGRVARGAARAVARATRRRGWATRRGRRTTRSRPASRRASSRRRRAGRQSEYEPGRGEAGGPPPEVAAERAAAVAAGDPNAGPADRVGRLAADPDRPPQDVDPGRSRSRGRSTRTRRSTGLERWKARHPGGRRRYLEPADILVDGMRGRSSLWYRVRVNLIHVPEADRPTQEPLEPDYDPWAGQDIEAWKAATAGSSARADDAEAEVEGRRGRDRARHRAGRAGRRRRHDLGGTSRRGHDRPGQPVGLQGVCVRAQHARRVARLDRVEERLGLDLVRVARGAPLDRLAVALEADDPAAGVAGRAVGLLQRERGHQPVRREARAR